MNQSNKLLSRIALILVIFIACGFLSSGLGVKLGLWDFRSGFVILKWAAYLAAAPVVLIIVDLILAKFQNRKIAIINSIVVLMIAAVVFGMPYFTNKGFQKIPTVADITTDFVDAPEFLNLVQTREATSSNPLSYRGKEAIELQKKYFPSLKPILTNQSPAQVIQQAEVFAKELGYGNINSNLEKGLLEATETTFWFDFKDDIVIRAKLVANGKTKVDIRSASRVGYLDGGLNGRRVSKFNKRLSK